MRNPTHTGTTVQQVEKEMMLCLRGSGDREGEEEEGCGSANSIAHWRRRREIPVPVVHQPEEDAPFNG